MSDFPKHPLRILTYSAGGSRDLVARTVAQGISGPLGQPVTVEYIPGYDAAAAELVAKAPADGYTLLAMGSPLWVTPFFKKVTYDTVRDFSPITLAVTQPNLLVVHPSVAANSLAELLAYARAHPGKLKYACGLPGSGSHLASALFTYQANVKMTRVMYEVNASATSTMTARTGINDLIAGEVDMMIFSAGSALPHVKSGKVKALAVTSAQPSALTPGLPTVASVLPGYEAASPHGFYAPAATPAAVIQRLNYEMVRLLKTPAVIQEFINAGVEAIGSSPDAQAAAMKTEMAMLGKMIKEVGIT